MFVSQGEDIKAAFSQKFKSDDQYFNKIFLYDEKLEDTEETHKLLADRFIPRFYDSGDFKYVRKC